MDTTTDTNRRFANLLPQFAASNGKIPAYQNGQSILTANDQRQFNALVKGFALTFVNKLWSLDLINCRSDGNITISRTRLIDAIQQFMVEVKDCRYSESFEVDAFNELHQCFYSPENARKALINHKGHQAQAILLCAYLTGIRLTDAQRKWLESAANGRYLTDKYSQYKSGAAGTLAPKVQFKGVYAGSEAQRQDFIEYTREARIGLTYGKYQPFTATLNL